MMRLKELRLKAKITQSELAKLLNCSCNTISRYEIGGREPDYDTVIKLADIFNVSIDYLLGRTDDPLPTEKASSAITTEEAIKILAKEKFGLNPTEQDMYDLDLAMESAINALIKRKRKNHK